MDWKAWPKDSGDHLPLHQSSGVMGVEEFNEALKSRLDGDPTARTGWGSLTDLVVQVGQTNCRLYPDTTLEGVTAYLRGVASAGGVYSLVRSTEDVVRRLVPGRRPQRIRGFYLYAESPIEEPRVVAPVTRAMDHWEIAMLILESVAVLHRRGHQRLRIYPNIAGSGMAWRTRVIDVDTARFDDFGVQWPRAEGAAYAYTTAARYDVGGMLVDTTCTTDELADHVLQAFPDPARVGRARDWMYAGWFGEMLESARQHRNLPVGDEQIRVGDRMHWTFLPAAGNSVEEPPPFR